MIRNALVPLDGSTLSEAIDNLVQRDFVQRHTDTEDRRRVHYRLTSAGQQALDDSSILSPARLGAVLERLGPTDRERAVVGLELLAGACAPSFTGAAGQ